MIVHDHIDKHIRLRARFILKYLNFLVGSAGSGRFGWARVGSAGFGWVRVDSGEFG